MSKDISKKVLRLVREIIEEYGLLARGEMVVVGVSGGADSLCLLDVLCRLKPEYDVSLHVAHLDHGIRGQEAKEDAIFVRKLCEQRGLDYTIGRWNVPRYARKYRLSLEEAARQARYAFLGQVARRVGSRTVAVAHNADDQAETVLMHFLRGSGLAGLRGMLPVSWMDELRLASRRESLPLESGRVKLIRPLLRVWREQVEAYCRARGLAPRFDRSNLDQTYFRNRLRHQVLPYLETVNPNIRELLLRTAQVAAGDYQVLRQVLGDQWPDVVRSASEQAIILDRAAFEKLPIGLQRSFIRESVHRLEFSLRDIDWVHVENAIRVVRTGRVGAEATLPRGMKLVVDYDRIVVAGPDYEPTSPDWPRVARQIALSVPGAEQLPDGGGWRVSTRLVRLSDLEEDWARNPNRFVAYLDAECLDLADLRLRPRRSGDRFVPLGLEHQQSVRSFMINAHVPRKERDRIPLLVSGGRILWVVGWRLDARCAIRPGRTRRVLVVSFSKSYRGDS